MKLNSQDWSLMVMVLVVVLAGGYMVAHAQAPQVRSRYAECERATDVVLCEILIDAIDARCGQCAGGP